MVGVMLVIDGMVIWLRNAKAPASLVDGAGARVIRPLSAGQLRLAMKCMAHLYVSSTTEQLTDQKDLRFGMGLSATHIRDCGRRDRLLFLSALGHAFITLLGAPAESIGYDRLMKANTVKTRTHSLFRQARTGSPGFQYGHR
jgi:hypothetical protein